MKHYDVLTLRWSKKLWAIVIKEPIKKNRLQPTDYKLKAHKCWSNANQFALMGAFECPNNCSLIILGKCSIRLVGQQLTLRPWLMDIEEIAFEWRRINKERV
jgi:hypothetical protein